jgi:hypothetical protein
LAEKGCDKPYRGLHNRVTRRCSAPVLRRVNRGRGRPRYSPPVTLICNPPVRRGNRDELLVRAGVCTSGTSAWSSTPIPVRCRLQLSFACAVRSLGDSTLWQYPERQITLKDTLRRRYANRARGSPGRNGGCNQRRRFDSESRRRAVEGHAGGADQAVSQDVDRLPDRRLVG